MVDQNATIYFSICVIQFDFVDFDFKFNYSKDLEFGFWKLVFQIKRSENFDSFEIFSKIGDFCDP